MSRSKISVGRPRAVLKGAVQGHAGRPDRRALGIRLRGALQIWAVAGLLLAVWAGELAGQRISPNMARFNNFQLEFYFQGMPNSVRRRSTPILGYTTCVLELKDLRRTQASAATEFEIVIRQSLREIDYYGPLTAISVPTRLTLQPGQTSVRAVVAIPGTPAQGPPNLEFEIREVGGDAWSVSATPYEEYSYESEPVQPAYKPGNYTLFEIPETRSLNRLCLEQGGEYCWLDGRNLQPSPSEQLESLPDRWQELMSYDMIVLGVDAWLELKNTHRQKLPAIRRWVLAGGALVIHGLDDLPGDDKLLEGLCSSFPVTPVQREPEIQVPESNRIPLSRLLGTTPSYNRDFWTDKVRYADVGQGRVYVAVGNPPANHLSDLSGPYRIEGFSPYSVEYDGGLSRRLGLVGRFEPQLLIPGVGQPPVIAFGLLILLFVLVIGPVNYIYFRRRQRLHLILLTIPLLSFLACASLLVYAVFMDGFGISTRMRSLTVIDPATGSFNSYSRHQMFGGSVPAGGYEFPDSDLVHVSRGTHGSLRYELDGGVQRFSGGQIRGRTEHQIARHRVGEIQQGVELRAVESGWVVINHFQCEIAELEAWIEGRRYAASHIAAGAEKPLLPLGPGYVYGGVRELIEEEFVLEESYYQSSSGMMFEAGSGSLPKGAMRGSFDFARMPHLGQPETAVYQAIILEDFELCPPVDESMHIRKQTHLVVGKFEGVSGK